MNATPELVSAMDETQTALRRCLEGKSWRELGKELGISHGVLHSFAMGRWEHVGWQQFAVIRQALGLPDLELYVTAGCPDCGNVHAGRCHGKPVGVVIIRPPHAPRPPVPAWLREAAAWLRQRENRHC